MEPSDKLKRKPLAIELPREPTVDDRLAELTLAVGRLAQMFAKLADWNGYAAELAIRAYLDLQPRTEDERRICRAVLDNFEAQRKNGQPPADHPSWKR